MIIRVKAPGSCGELVQGTIAGRSFLVTCPINLYSEVEINTSQQSLEVSAGDKIKKAIIKTLKYCNITDFNCHITVRSELPQGKGMASSSADISAACQAAALSVGNKLTADQIADIALSIEPTDGVFYPGIVMFDHVQGLTRRYLGKPPAVSIAVFDVGGKVDTLNFNQRSDLKKLNKAKEPQVCEALEMIVKGLTTGNTCLIGQGATLSALANQSILFKPCLEKVIHVAKRFNAIGVNAAHSGTVLGVMFDSSDLSLYHQCIESIQQACADVRFLRSVQLISGGLLVQEANSNEWQYCV